VDANRAVLKDLLAVSKDPAPVLTCIVNAGQTCQFLRDGKTQNYRRALHHMTLRQYHDYLYAFTRVREYLAALQRKQESLALFCRAGQSPFFRAMLFNTPLLGYLPVKFGPLPWLDAVSPRVLGFDKVFCLSSSKDITQILEYSISRAVHHYQLFGTSPGQHRALPPLKVHYLRRKTPAFPRFAREVYLQLKDLLYNQPTARLMLIGDSFLIRWFRIYTPPLFRSAQICKKAPACCDLCNPLRAILADSSQAEARKPASNNSGQAWNDGCVWACYNCGNLEQQGDGCRPCRCCGSKEHQPVELSAFLLEKSLQRQQGADRQPAASAGARQTAAGPQTGPNAKKPPAKAGGF
jgi:hypothetical protein